MRGECFQDTKSLNLSKMQESNDKIKRDSAAIQEITAYYLCYIGCSVVIKMLLIDAKVRTLLMFLDAVKRGQKSMNQISLRNNISMSTLLKLEIMLAEKGIIKERLTGRSKELSMTESGLEVLSALKKMR